MREAGIVLTLAELERLDVVRPATREDGVEHLWQEKRIDDVAGTSRRVRRAARTCVNLRVAAILLIPWYPERPSETDERPGLR